MEKFRYIKYQEKYHSYYTLFEQDQESQKMVSFSKEYLYLIFIEEKFIGLFSLTPWYNSKIEIRLWILPQYRNQGLGTKVTQDICTFAFSSFPQSNTIISNINYQNEASKKSVQKAGFTFDFAEHEKRQEMGEGCYYEPFIKNR